MSCTRPASSTTACCVDLTAERFDAVAAAKVTGAEHLAAATDPHHPDHFVVFSAGAGLLGSPGQANYAAANAVIDALAWRRRVAGRPALAIDWGPWKEVGMTRRPRSCGPAPLGVPGHRRS